MNIEQQLFNTLTSAFLLTQKVTFKRQVEKIAPAYLSKAVLSCNSNCFNEYEIKRAIRAIETYSIAMNFKPVRSVKIKNVSLNEMLNTYNRYDYYKHVRENHLMNNYYFRCLHENLSQFISIINYYVNAKLSIHTDENSASFNAVLADVLKHDNSYFENGYPCDLFVHDRSEWSNNGYLAVRNDYCSTYKNSDLNELISHIKGVADLKKWTIYDCKTGKTC